MKLNLKKGKYFYAILAIEMCNLQHSKKDKTKMY